MQKVAQEQPRSPSGDDRIDFFYWHGWWLAATDRGPTDSNWHIKDDPETSNAVLMGWLDAKGSLEDDEN